MIGYKGFDENFCCKGMQYKVGETYRVDGELKICEHGLHFCDEPLGVFAFYPPSGSRYALVEAAGEIVKDKNAHKFCTGKLKIVKELSLDELIGVVSEKLSVPNTDNYSAATATGNYSVASNAGCSSAATNAGNYSAATATGKESVAVVTGKDSKAKGAPGCWIVLTERDYEMHILDIKAFKVDGEKIKPDTFYTLKDGVPVAEVDIAQE